MKSKISWIRRAQRCFRMLSELHRMGYQNLRCMSYINPLGYRFAIAPKSLFSEYNGAVIPSDKLTGEGIAFTAAGDYFGWSDTQNDNARALAEKFILRFPEIANRGKGRDWAYAGWLSELIGFLEQGDWIPAVWWETMKGKSEDLRTLPIWIADADNYCWEGSDSIISPDNPTFPLPPTGVICDVASRNTNTDAYRWGQDRYWTDALDAFHESAQAGVKNITIDVHKLYGCIYGGDGPAFKLLRAMKSVYDHEGYEGYKGAPRLVFALLWRLLELERSTGPR